MTNEQKSKLIADMKTLRTLKVQGNTEEMARVKKDMGEWYAENVEQTVESAKEVDQLFADVWAGKI